MTENRNDSAPTSPPFSDLAQVDAHVIQPEEYDDIPELTDDWFERGSWFVDGVEIKRGRPKSPAPKKAVNIRLSQAVIDAFKADGPGWQTRINAALEAWLAQKAEAAE